MLRATRAAHHNTSQRSKHKRLPETPGAGTPDAIKKDKGRESVAALEARMMARGKEKLNGKCIGLLDGESEAAAQLCNQVNADTQYMLRRNAAGPPEDMMQRYFTDRERVKHTYGAWGRLSFVSSVYCTLYVRYRRVRCNIIIKQRRAKSEEPKTHK